MYNIVNLKTDSKTLYYSHWKKLKIYSFFCQALQRLKEIWAVKQQPQKSNKQDTSDWSKWSFNLRNAYHKLFCVFGDFCASGTQDAEVTKSLYTVKWNLCVNLFSPKSDQHQFSPTISIHDQGWVMRNNKNHLFSENTLILKQILSTSFSRKCMAISVENLYVTWYWDLKG